MLGFSQQIKLEFVTLRSLNMKEIIKFRLQLVCCQTNICPTSQRVYPFVVVLVDV